MRDKQQGNVRDCDQFIEWFHSKRVMELHSVGGKGINIDRVIKAGFPVPRGFCITTRAFMDFINQGSLHKRIAGEIENIDIYDLAGIQRKSRQILGLILGSQIPPHIASVISEAYRSLIVASGGNCYVAIRSSTVCEDMPETSFAGQHHTFLGVSGEKQLLERVRECWASLWTGRALAYRCKKRIDHNQVFISVIVQEMINSEAAGVMFTANPITADRNEIIIDATWGLGEPVVAGKTIPDHYAVDKNDFKVVEKRIPEKRFKVVIDYENRQGTAILATRKEEALHQVLSNEAIRELAMIGRGVEKSFQTPLDIEWCKLGDRYYVLQSRPITVLGAQHQHDDLLAREIERLKKEAGNKEVVWSNMFFAELLPSPTPFSFDFAKRMAVGIGNAYEEMGIRLPQWDEMPITLICGRAYFKVNEFASIPSLNGFPIEDIVLQQLTAQPLDVHLDKALILDKLAWSLCIKSPIYVYRVIKIGLIFLRKAIGFDKLYRSELLPSYIKHIDGIKRCNLGDSTDKELVRNLRMLFDHASQDPRKYWELGNILSIVTYELLSYTTKLLVSDSITAADLIKGEPGNKALETNIEIWKLSEKARGLATVFKNNNPKEILAELQRSVEGREFLSCLYEFLDQYGHRGYNELEFSNPRWSEDPRYILSVIRSYLMRSTIDIVEDLNEKRKRANELSSEIKKHLSSKFRDKILPVKRWLFSFVLRMAKRYAPYRETPKFYFQMETAIIRNIALEIGRRLAAERILKEANDIFFLNLDEINDVVSSTYDGKRAAILVEARKQKRKIALSIELPRLIFSSELEELGKMSESESAEELVGIPIARGVVVGSACVVKHQGDLCKLKPGEIMVARSMDPSWIAFLGFIGGIIVESGTALSHGAIVAREYDIPGVADIKDATKVIHDGQKLRVDGTVGKVWLL